ncbi:hypothetical protein MAR_019902 [Mya arenaria]|uniref:Uncharacterized protein n=1 Tax=Mya arenaria TaxID=6604 RepID=A0ABY7E3H0_MYAAR|nr:hypothetical protein MAR_019902 [Mya arenaria]
MYVAHNKFEVICTCDVVRVEGLTSKHMNFTAAWTIITAFPSAADRGVAYQAQPTKPKSSKKRRRSEPEPPSPELPGINIHNADENVSVVAAIDNLAEQMRVSLDSLSSRIVKHETNLELTIKTHVQNAMSPVVNKLRKEFNEDLNQVKSDMKSLPVNNAVPKESEQKKTTGLVLKNLPERRDENIVNSVNTLIKVGLKLDIKMMPRESVQINPPNAESLW